MTKSLQSIHRALRLVQGLLLGSGLSPLSLLRHPRPSIRAMTRALGCHPEILRRRLKALGRRSGEIREKLALSFAGVGSVCLLDPTFIKDSERLLVIALLEPLSGRAVLSPELGETQR